MTGNTTKPGNGLAQPLAPFPLIALIVNIMSGGSWFWMILPLAGIVMADKGVPPWKIGLIGSVPWVFTIIMIVLLPAATRLVAPIRLYRSANWMLLAAAVTFCVTDNLGLWTLAYAFAGTATAIRWILTESFIATMPPPETRARWFSAYMLASSVIIIIGPLLVFFLGTGTLTFQAGVGLVGISVLLGHLTHITNDHLGGEIEERGSPVFFLTFLPLLPAALAAMAVSGVIDSVISKLLPVQALGLGFDGRFASLSVAVFGAGDMLTLSIFGLLSHRLNAGRLLPLILAATGLGALALPLASQNEVSYCAVLFWVGGLTGLNYTLAVFSGMQGRSPAEGVRVMSSLGLAYMIGATIGPALTGAVTSLSLLWGLPLVIASSALPVAALAWRLRNHSGRNAVA